MRRQTRREQRIHARARRWELAFHASVAVLYASVVGLISAFAWGPLWMAQYLVVSLAAALAGLAWSLPGMRAR